MDQKRALWIAEVADRGALVRLIRAALTHGVAPVSLPDTHLASGVHTLQIRLGGEPVVVLAAELAGETASGSYALRLAPLDPSHVPELCAISERDDSIAPGPMSASASSMFDAEPALPSSAPLRPAVPSAMTRTLRDPEPEDVDEDELEASVLFDPEAALISRAPARPDGTSPEDTLTIPVRASMMPPATTTPLAKPIPRRPSSGPHTISHLSIPSIPSAVPMTERQDPQDMNNASSDRHATTQRQGSVADGTLSVSVSVEFDTSQSAVNTQRNRPSWTNEDGASAPDPSLSESVVFDPDILAREQRMEEKAAHPADVDEFSVVFGNEETSPGVTPSGSKPPRPLGVVVSSMDDDLSLTPTMPMDIPPRRPASQRDPVQRAAELKKRFDDTVEDEADTYPRDSGRFIPSTQAASSMSASMTNPPRTQKRTAPTDVVVAGRVIANRYRIESLVGAGAVGAVYKASHVDLPRTFAIKVLHPHYRADPQLMASFRTEARAASLLDHPNVTVVHDFGEEPDGLVYIVMEYLPGANLQAILDEERRVAPRRAIEIMLQVCGALSAAHDRGIVHRDVKPDNIMLIPSRDDEGRPYELVKVCDFGIAALETAPDAGDGEWTAGTPEYMAPEQAHGRADARTDVYACGIVLYEMLTGRPPFVGESPIATLTKHATEMARRPSEIVPGFPPALEAVILCAIEKAPDRRFGTMRDLRVELKRLL